MFDDFMAISSHSQTKLSVRERLLNAAGELFYNYGINATGIDMITAKAGVAKMSLYNNFTSKADLVAAFIEMRNQEWLDLYAIRLKTADTAAKRILAIFDAYTDHAEFSYENGFRGCGLLNAAAELSVGDQARLAIRCHKEQIEQFLIDHLREYQTENAVKLTEHQITSTAEHLAFLLEGAICRAGLEGNSMRMKHGRQLAETVLAAL